MFFYTDTADAPWTVIKSDCKKRAPPQCDALPSCTSCRTRARTSDRVGPLDPLLVGRAHVVYERGEHREPIL